MVLEPDLVVGLDSDRLHLLHVPLLLDYGPDMFEMLLHQALLHFDQLETLVLMALVCDSSRPVLEAGEPEGLLDEVPLVDVSVADEAVLLYGDVRVSWLSLVWVYPVHCCLVLMG